MNTKFSALLASLLMVGALGATAAHADNKVDMNDGKAATQMSEKEAAPMQQAQKPAVAHKVAAKATHKAKVAKKHHAKAKHHAVKHKAKAKHKAAQVKTSAKPVTKPSK